MQVFVGCDHAAVAEKNALKEFLVEKGFNVTDCGIQEGEKADYPLMAQKVCDEVLKNEENFGFLICGTGIGISIKANRNKGIRAALAYDEFSAAMAKEHNNANIICFGARTMGTQNILKYTQAYLDATYAGLTEEGKRHDNRVKMLDMD